MGAWGVGISSNDEYMDIHSEIMDEFNKGRPIQAIVEEVVSKYEHESYADERELHNLYFAAAYALWDCGGNDQKIFDKVKSIINEGKDIEWRHELGATKEDQKKRQQALNKFLTQISIPKEKPRKPKLIKYRPAIFEKGAVISILQDDGTYSGAVVMENLKGSERFGSNFIIKGTMHNEEKPTVKDVLVSIVHHYSWYGPGFFRKYKQQIEIIGKIEINHEYIEGGIGSSVSSWSGLVSCNKTKDNNDTETIQEFVKLNPLMIYTRQKQRVMKRLP